MNDLTIILLILLIIFIGYYVTNISKNIILLLITIFLVVYINLLKNTIETMENIDFSCNYKDPTKCIFKGYEINGDQCDGRNGYAYFRFALANYTPEEIKNWLASLYYRNGGGPGQIKEADVVREYVNRCQNKPEVSFTRGLFTEEELSAPNSSIPQNLNPVGYSGQAKSNSSTLKPNNECAIMFGEYVGNGKPVDNIGMINTQSNPKVYILGDGQFTRIVRENGEAKYYEGKPSQFNPNNYKYFNDISSIGQQIKFDCNDPFFVKQKADETLAKQKAEALAKQQAEALAKQKAAEALAKQKAAEALAKQQADILAKQQADMLAKQQADMLAKQQAAEALAKQKAAEALAKQQQVVNTSNQVSTNKKSISCPDRCLFIELDNNNENKFIQLSNGTKYYIKNKILHKDDNSYPMNNGRYPVYVFKRRDQNTIFIHDNNNQLQKLTKNGYNILDDVDLDDYNGNPDGSNCCLPQKLYKN